MMKKLKTAPRLPGSVFPPREQQRAEVEPAVSSPARPLPAVALPRQPEPVRPDPDNRERPGQRLQRLKDFERADRPPSTESIFLTSVEVQPDCLASG